MVADNAATLTRTSAHYEGVVNVRERSPQTVVMRHQSTFLRPLRGSLSFGLSLEINLAFIVL
jgi:hypothetical protein